MSNNGPCKDCPNRHRACWNSCEKYLAFKKEQELIRKNRKEYNAKVGSIFNGHGKYIRTITSKMKRKDGEDGKQ